LQYVGCGRVPCEKVQGFGGPDGGFRATAPCLLPVFAPQAAHVVALRPGLALSRVWGPIYTGARYDTTEPGVLLDGSVLPMRRAGDGELPPVRRSPYACPPEYNAPLTFSGNCVKI